MPFFKWFLVSLMMISLTGCIDLEVNIGLREDGSATTELQAKMLDQMYQNLAFIGPQLGFDTAFLKEDGAREYMTDHGGTLQTYKNYSKDGFRHIHMSGTLADGRAWLHQVGQDQTSLIAKDGLFEWRLLNKDAGSSLLNMDDAMIAKQLSILGPQLAGLRCALRIQVPHLADTNLKRTSPQTAVFEIDYDRDLGEKSGEEAMKAFRSIFSPKWMIFSLQSQP